MVIIVHKYHIIIYERYINIFLLQGAEKLEKLDISNNFIVEFPTVSLKKIDNLKILNLSSNLIQVSKFVILYLMKSLFYFSTSH